jgi:HSP20 family protein
MLVKFGPYRPDITPWRELEELPRRFARMFNEPFFPDFITKPVFNPVFTPAVNIAELEGELLITAELPGLKKEEVEIRIEEGVLTIMGEKKEEAFEYEPRLYLWERAYGKFERAFTLPRNFNPDLVKAEFKDGLLYIHLPKVEPAKGKNVEILTK